MQSIITRILPVLLLIVLSSACNRSKSIAVKPVQFATFLVNGIDQATEAEQLRKQLINIQGITAATVNMKNGLVAVSYHADQINERKIKIVLDQIPGLQTHSYQLTSNPNKPQCPVKKARNWLSFI